MLFSSTLQWNLHQHLKIDLFQCSLLLVIYDDAYWSNCHVYFLVYNIDICLTKWTNILTLVLFFKCANCNRDAFAECSLCRHTPYCSTFCQRKDWGSHQVECVHSAAGDQGSIMLIVESTSEPVLNQQE